MLGAFRPIYFEELTPSNRSLIIVVIVWTSYQLAVSFRLCMLLHWYIVGPSASVE